MLNDDDEVDDYRNELIIFMLCDQKVLQDRKKIINYHDGVDHVSDGHGGD